MLSDQQYDDLIETRARRPEAVAEAARSRKPRDQMDTGRGLLLIAADHAARGVVGTEENPTALASRRYLLGRLFVAMGHQAVDGYGRALLGRVPAHDVRMTLLKSGTGDRDLVHALLALPETHLN